MLAIKLTLANIHPALPYLVLVFVVGALVWLWRWKAPVSFELLPKWAQHFPAILLGAVLSASASGDDFGRLMVDAVIGALSGVTAVGGHHFLKDSPLSYGRKKKS